MEEISGRRKALPETQTQDIRHWLTCLNGLTWTEDQGFLRKFISLRAISITTFLIFDPVVGGWMNPARGKWLFLGLWGSFGSGICWGEDFVVYYEKLQHTLFVHYFDKLYKTILP